MAERDGAHRHQRAEVDAPGHEALRQALRVEGVEQRPARHGQRQRAVEIRFVAGGDPVVESVAQAGVQVLVGFVHGQEQIVEQGGEALSPVAGAAVAAALAPVVFQGVEQARQAPGQLGAQAGHFVQRLDAHPGRAVAEQVAGQHAFQAERPTVLFEAGYVQGLPLFAVQPPADARLVDPAGQLRQVALVDAEAFAHRRHVQQVEDVGGGEAPLRQMQQRLHRLGQRRGGAGAAVAERVGQIARVVPLQAAEHGVNVRRIGFDVRHHDDHVAGLQLRVGAEAVEQLVLQNLHLPLGAVADAEAQRAVRRQRRLFSGGRQRLQVENVLLQPLQQGARLQVLEQIDLVLKGAAVTVRVVVVVEQADKIAALLAPGGEQRIDWVVRQRGQVTFAVVQLTAQQLFVLDDVGPVMLTGVLHQHQDLAVAAERRQGFQRLLGQGADAENNQPARQARRRRVLLQSVLLKGLDEGPVDGAAAEPLFVRVHVREQGAPQMRLPQLAGGEVVEAVPVLGPAQPVVAPFPVRQPVGPVDLVGVEQIRQPLRQLVAFAAVHVVGQEVAQRTEMGGVEQGGQQPVQAPQQPRLVERRGARHPVFTERGAVGAPQEAGRHLELETGADAQRPGQLQFQPLGHAVGLDQEDLLVQRRQRVLPQPVRHQLGERLQPVAVQHHETVVHRRLPLSIPYPRPGRAARQA